MPDRHLERSRRRAEHVRNYNENYYTDSVHEIQCVRYPRESRHVYDAPPPPHWITRSEENSRRQYVRLRVQRQREQSVIPLPQVNRGRGNAGRRAGSRASGRGGYSRRGRTPNASRYAVGNNVASARTSYTPSVPQQAETARTTAPPPLPAVLEDVSEAEKSDSENDVNMTTNAVSAQPAESTESTTNVSATRAANENILNTRNDELLQQVLCYGYANAVRLHEHRLLSTSDTLTTLRQLRDLFLVFERYGETQCIDLLEFRADVEAGEGIEIQALRAWIDHWQIVQPQILSGWTSGILALDADRAARRRRLSLNGISDVENERTELDSAFESYYNYAGVDQSWLPRPCVPTRMEESGVGEGVGDPARDVRE